MKLMLKKKLKGKENFIKKRTRKKNLSLTLINFSNSWFNLCYQNNLIESTPIKKL